MKKIYLKIEILAIILIVLMSILITPKTFQNDTFYTISIGEHIKNNWIDMKDPFSWHENLEYTYPHWAYDFMTYLIYSVFGFQGIYIATILLTITLGLVMFFCNVKLGKNKLLTLVITLIAMYLLKDFIAARAQLLTFCLFVLEIFFIEKYLETKGKIYAIGLIVIPILLANFHLAVFPFYFILYLPYIGEYVVHYLLRIRLAINSCKIQKIYQKAEKENNKENLNKLKEKLNKLEEENIKEENFLAESAYKIEITKNKNVKGLIIIMIICIFTGLLTPLGLTPYTYLIKTMQGNTTKNISEHLPLTLANDINVMVILTVFTVLLAFMKTKIRLSDLFMLGGLVLLTFYSRRQESMLIIAGVYIFIKLIHSVVDRKIIEKIDKNNVDCFIVIILLCVVGILGVPTFKNTIKQSYINENSYPVQASEFILNNLNKEEIKLYNEYNYGSYLLFKDIPVFIDSRADLYSPEFNNNVDVFTDFLNINGMNLDIIDIEDKLSEYGITHLILYKNNSKSKLARYIEYMPERYKRIYPTEELKDENFYIFERLY